MKLSNIVSAALYAGAGAVFVASRATAGEQHGTITSLYVRDSDGLIYFYMSGTHANKPACAGNECWRIKSENTDKGKRQYAALLAAFMDGKTIYVSGPDACTRWVDGEMSTRYVSTREVAAYRDWAATLLLPPAEAPLAAPRD